MASKISRFFSLVSIVSSFLDDAMSRNTPSFFVVVVVVVVFDAPSSASTTVLALFLRAEDDDKDKDDESPTPRTPNLCVLPNDGLVKKRERRTTTKVASTRWDIFRLLFVPSNKGQRLFFSLLLPLSLTRKDKDVLLPTMVFERTRMKNAFFLKGCCLDPLFRVSKKSNNFFRNAFLSLSLTKKELFEM